MATYPFALYDAFTDRAFGGSQAAVISNASAISADQRRSIAKEIGVPATCFVEDYDAKSVTARFQSMVMELPMCGHGTICMMTYMVEEEGVFLAGGSQKAIDLVLPTGPAKVEVSRDTSGRAQVMLDISSPVFRQDDLDMSELAQLLGADDGIYNNALPSETAAADFTHLVVPIKDLESMGRISPDFSGVRQFCLDHGIETIAVFCLQTVQNDYTIHVRDFCPAVGVPESAAAGTTNGALASYLIRHQLVTASDDGLIVVHAEQGHEISRPSSIHTIAHMSGGEIGRLQVGGVATKVMEGHIHVPPEGDAL